MASTVSNGNDRLRKGNLRWRPDWQNKRRTDAAANMDEAECKAEFCVEKDDLHRLAEALQIPGTLKSYQGTVYSEMEGL